RAILALRSPCLYASHLRVAAYLIESPRDDQRFSRKAPDHDVVNCGTLYFRDGAVRTIERTAGTRARDARRRPASARAVTHAQVACSPRRLGAAIQSASVGFSPFCVC